MSHISYRTTLADWSLCVYYQTEVGNATRNSIPPTLRLALQIRCAAEVCAGSVLSLDLAGAKSKGGAS